MRKTLSLLVVGLTALALPGFAEQEASAQDIPEQIVKKVDPSVVCIMHERACGSGFVVSKDGYIISNGHVVQGNDPEDPLQPAKLITVITSDEKKYPAKVIGYCMNPDVSLLKIEPEGEMLPVEFADSRAVKIGEKCFAVGAPLGLKRTFTSGILSSIDRTDLGTFTKVFQTDAAINPGNSGGPLFTQAGRVIGINTYGMNTANNLGFTIPAHVVQVLKEHFKKHGRFIRSDLPVCSMVELYDELAKALHVEKGVLVEYVMAGTSADKAGLKEGDIITAINGKPCSARTTAEMLDINWDLTVMEPGTKVTFTVLRGAGDAHKTLEVPMVLELSEPVPDMSFPGEIVTYKNDTLGVGYQQVVQLHRVIYGIIPQQGVLLDAASLDKEGTFAKAGLKPFDVITHVEGKAVADPDSFSRELEKCLARKDRYIDIKASRRKAEVNTTLAPYYDLGGKKVAIVMPSGKSEYLDLVLRELLSDGADITIVQMSKDKPVISEAYAFPLKQLQEIKGAQFNALLFMDCADRSALRGNDGASGVVKDAFAAKRVLAAIGASALLLTTGDEELLKKKITASEDVASELIKKKANYTGNKVEKDGTLVTTTGFDKETVRTFLRSFRQVVRGSDTIK